MTPPLNFSRRATCTPPSPISYFMAKALGNPDLISLAAGFVDTPSLPTAEVDAAWHTLMQEPHRAKSALQYGSTQGYTLLRQAIAGLVAKLDGADWNRYRPEQIVVTTGAQQLLYLLSECLLDAGDIVIAESPSYFVYQSVLDGHGVRVLSVPMDDEGMKVDELRKLWDSLTDDERSRVKLIYTVDYFQNPTGLSLSESRRRELLDFVKSVTFQRILILEDAAYRELRYDGADIPSLASMDRDNTHVVYAGTFSKPFAPGLKTGYAIMPSDMVEPITRIKGNHDFGSGNLAQYLLEIVMANGDYDKHLQELLAVYREKRDAMLNALAEHFSDLSETSWTMPKGGMFVWLTLPADVATGNESPLAEAAIQDGVLYIPGEFGFPDPASRPSNMIRLSFGDSTPTRIREGVRRLRVAVQSVLPKEPSPSKHKSAVGVG